MTNNILALADNKTSKIPNLQNGIAKLVLTLVKTLTELLERQALRRIDAGTLTKEEVENMGLAFVEIKNKIKEISGEFGLKSEELSLNAGLQEIVSEDKGSLQLLNQVSLVDLLDKVIDKGAMIAGEVKVSVANVDLVVLNLLATVSSIDNLNKIRKDGG